VIHNSLILSTTVTSLLLHLSILSIEFQTQNSTFSCISHFGILFTYFILRTVVLRANVNRFINNYFICYIFFNCYWTYIWTNRLNIALYRPSLQFFANHFSSAEMLPRSKKMTNAPKPIGLGTFVIFFV
jgi:hypothetical protein